MPEQSNKPVVNLSEKELLKALQVLRSSQLSSLARFMGLPKAFMPTPGGDLADQANAIFDLCKEAGRLGELEQDLHEMRSSQQGSLQPTNEPAQTPAQPASVHIHNSGHIAGLAVGDSSLSRIDGSVHQSGHSPQPSSRMVVNLTPLTDVDHLAFLYRCAEDTKNGRKVWNDWRLACQEIMPDLNGAKLSDQRLHLQRFDFSQCELRGADLNEANLHAVNFRGADLSGACLKYSFLGDADLRRASLVNANLIGANLGWAKIGDTDFSDAKFAFTSFCNVDLSTATVLSATHCGPSTVGTDTLNRTALGVEFDCQRRKDLESFWRLCGLNEKDIQIFRQAIVSPSPYHSVVICYCSKSRDDELFVQYLRKRLTLRGVLCWCDVEDMIIGEIIEDRLREVIRERDRVLLCCSEAALKSEWVRKEFEFALEKEDEAGGHVLIPLDVDGYYSKAQDKIAKTIQSRLVGDFTGWEDTTEFERQFEKVLKALERKTRN